MDLDQALKALDAAKLRKAPWQELATVIETVRSTGAWKDRYTTPTAWIAAAAHASGYSAGALNRMIACLRFLKLIVSEKPGLSGASEILDPAAGAGLLSSVELLKRIYDVDPGRARELISVVAGHAITFRQLKAEYDKVISAPQPDLIVGNPPFAGRRGSAADNEFLMHYVGVAANKLGIRHSRQFEDNAFAIIKRNLVDLSGPGASIHLRRYRFKFANPDAVAIQRTGFSLVALDGFEFRNITAPIARNALNKLMAEIALSASFFRRYWLVLPRHGDFASRIADEAKELGLFSLGILEIVPQDKVTITLRPSKEPAPDRQEAAKREVFASGVPTS